MRENQRATGCAPIAGLAISVLFLANFTLGVFELPDNLPLIGNLDELFFSGLLFWSLAQLGVPLPFNRGASRTVTPRDSRDNT